MSLEYGTYIPYSNPSITAGYNPTYTNDNLKENTYLPLPTDTGVYDNVSTDMPLTWDNIKDTVISIPVDNVGEGVGVNVGTGEDSLTGVGDSILNPTFSKTIDLSPLYMDLSTKFPFSIPFDIYNLFKDFEVAKKRPVVSYSLPEKYFGTNKMEVDFAFYDDIFPFTTILRYFLLIGFVYFLIIKTRNLIGG